MARRRGPETCVLLFAHVHATTFLYPIVGSGLVQFIEFVLSLFIWDGTLLAVALRMVEAELDPVHKICSQIKFLLSASLANLTFHIFATVAATTFDSIYVHTQSLLSSVIRVWLKTPIRNIFPRTAVVICALSDNFSVQYPIVEQHRLYAIPCHVEAALQATASSRALLTAADPSKQYMLRSLTKVVLHSVPQRLLASNSQAQHRAKRHHLSLLSQSPTILHEASLSLPTSRPSSPPKTPHQVSSPRANPSPSACD